MMQLFFRQFELETTFDNLLHHISQWISLLYRRLQKIEQIKPDHCDRYQNNRIKNATEWH